jgi:hypothetical protein
MTATAFLSADLVDEIAKESSGSGRYINPAKIEGEIRLRFFGSGITGFEAWTDDNKPVRWETKPEQLPSNIRQQEGYPTLKRFLAGLVYDYASESFKILQITQKTLMDQLFKFMKDEDYGDPTGYDVKISRTGEGKKTEYTLVAAPPRAVAKDVQAAYDNLTCNLNALFDGDDPFAEATA